MNSQGFCFTTMRSKSSTPPIRRVTPGRDQERHVEVAFRLAHRKTQWDAIEKRRIRHRHLPCGKVIADAESQFVTADRYRPATDQPPIGPAVRIGYGTRYDAVHATLG